MPRITSIEPQKSFKSRSRTGRITRFNIFIDDKFAFSLDEKIIADEKLQVGINLTQAQIEKIIKSDKGARLFDTSLKFLSVRPRSEKEIKDYLSKKIARRENLKFSQASQSPIIPIVINKLNKFNYVNDKEFAIWWIKARVKGAKGPRIIQAELVKKGIDKSLIQELLINAPSSKKSAIEILRKKSARWKNLSEIQFKQKVVTFLASRGYDWETIQEIFAFLQKTR